MTTRQVRDLDEHDQLVEAADTAVIRERLASVDAGEQTFSLAEVLAENLARTE